MKGQRHKEQEDPDASRCHVRRHAQTILDDQVQPPVQSPTNPNVAKIDLVERQVAGYLKLNPMSWFLESYHAVLFYGTWPDPLMFGLTLAAAAAALAGGYAVFAHFRPRLPEELYYDLPPELIGTLWGGKYRGQRQTWYLARFTGADSDIDLEAHKHPEFCEWKWVDPELLPELIVPFKREVYAAIVAGFRELL